jgi:hypothetical protein
MRPYYLRELRDGDCEVIGYTVFRQPQFQGQPPKAMAEFRLDRAGRSTSRPATDLPTAFRLAHGTVEALNG